MALLTGVLARCAWVDINEVVSYSPEVSAKLSAIQVKICYITILKKAPLSSKILILSSVKCFH